MRSNQVGALDGVYLHLELQVLLRFLLVTGMAFGTLAAYFVIVAEWFAKSANDKNDLRSWCRSISWASPFAAAPAPSIRRRSYKHNRTSGLSWSAWA